MFMQVVPELFVHDGAAAMEFYKNAFGATEVHRMKAADGRRIMHGELLLDGMKLVVCDEFKADEGGTCRAPANLGGTPVRIVLIVADAEAAMSRAVAAGGRVTMPVQEMFWGGRYGKMIDPFGHEWGLNQQLREQTTSETESAAEEYFKKRPTG